MSRLPVVCLRLVLIFTFLLTAAPLAVRGQEATPAMGALPAGVEVVASGLTNPRGFTWGADGELFLALAGSGGPDQVIGEDGTEFPFFTGMTSSVVRVEEGCTVPVAEGIASFLWTDPGWIWGVMDLAILDGQLYALLGGGGADVGLPDNPNGVYRVNANGTTELIGDLSAFFRENPPSFTPWDYGADGSLFDMEAGADRLWISEAVGGRLLTVTPTGEMALIADLSEAHMVPTGVAVAPDGGAYVNHETVVPFPDGAAKVIHVAADGTVRDQWTGLTAGTDLVMGPDGALYAAEMATGNLDEAPYLRPDTGQVVRQTGPDSHEPVVTDIDSGFRPGRCALSDVSGVRSRCRRGAGCPAAHRPVGGDPDLAGGTWGAGAELPRPRGGDGLAGRRHRGRRVVGRGYIGDDRRLRLCTGRACGGGGDDGHLEQRGLGAAYGNRRRRELRLRSTRPGGDLRTDLRRGGDVCVHMQLPSGHGGECGRDLRATVRSVSSGVTTSVGNGFSSFGAPWW